MDWTIWILLSAVFLAFYDLAKKASVRDNAVLPTLLISTFCGGSAFIGATAVFGDVGSMLHPGWRLLALAGIVFAYRDQAAAFSGALTLFLNGQPLALAAYSRALTALLSVLLTCVGASLARSDQAFFPLALLTVFELLIVSLLGLGVDTLALLPLLAALMLVSRARSVGASRLLPMAALALALTLLCMPLAGRTVPERRSPSRCSTASEISFSGSVQISLPR